MRPLAGPILLLGALLTACGAPRQSDANPAMSSAFEPVLPLVDYSVPPSLPKLPPPSRRGSTPTIVDADGDRLPADWKLDEMIADLLHASWRDSPQDLTVRILAWQVIVDERPLLVEQVVLWMHFHPRGQAEFWRILYAYRHPREAAPHLQGWHRANRGPHSDKAGDALFEDEKPDHGIVVRFFNESGWSETSSGFTLLDASISAGAWKRAVGKAPGFAYP